MAYQYCPEILLRWRAIICCFAFLLLAACEKHPPPSHSFEVAINGINGAALSSNGQYSVIGSLFHDGSLWRNKDGERLYSWSHSKEADDRAILSAAIDSQNQWAITADAATLVLWNINDGSAARFWTSPAEVLDSDLSAGARYALLGLTDYSAVMFDVMHGGIVRRFGHKGRVRSVDISGDGRLAITGSEDQTAAIWQIDNGKLLFNVQHQEDVQLVRLSDDGSYALTAAKYDRVELWDVAQQTSLGTLPLAKEKLKRGLRITAATFDHHGKTLLLGYPNRLVELRELPSLDLMATWKLPKRRRWQPTSAAVIDLAFDQQEKRYWAISSDGFVHLLE